MRDHGLLAGMRDVDAGEAHALGRRQELAERRAGQLQAIDVDQLVEAAQPLRGGLLLMHGGRARCLDAAADQPQQQRARRRRRAAPRRSQRFSLCRHGATIRALPRLGDRFPRRAAGPLFRPR
jgi:hypothetical protein